MTLSLRPLRDSDFEAVLAGFNAAFSDYVVPFRMAADPLREMMARRGYVPEVSIAAFDGDAIAGFVLNSLDGAEAYNMGTGVAPGHRRRGLSREILEATVPLLRDRGVRRYTLEVIESNTPAVRLYQTASFRESRRLQCWTFDGATRPASPVRWKGTPVAPRPDWWDVLPSWQNSSTALARAREPFAVVGDDRGYAVVFPSNGDVPQLAVDPEHRRRGIGRALLQAAAAAAGKPLRLINVDDGDAGIAAFLEACGATRTIRQIEMVRDLAP